MHAGLAKHATDAWRHRSDAGAAKHVAEHAAKYACGPTGNDQLHGRYVHTGVLQSCVLAK